MTRFLLINTCGAEGVVALAEGLRVIDTASLPGRSSSEHLLPAIRRLMDDAGWRVRDLAAIGVVDGPGSFTGVRVGLSAAKGLCEAGEVGLIAMSRLALVAAAAQDPGAEVAALLDAGRSEFFCGLYAGALCQGEELVARAGLEALVGNRPCVTSEPRVAQSLSSGVVFHPQVVAEPGAELMLPMAAQRVTAGAWTDLATADANYLRQTDAEILLQKRAL